MYASARLASCVASTSGARPVGDVKSAKGRVSPGARSRAKPRVVTLLRAAREHPGDGNSASDDDDDMAGGADGLREPFGAAAGRSRPSPKSGQPPTTAHRLNKHSREFLDPSPVSVPPPWQAMEFIGSASEVEDKEESGHDKEARNRQEKGAFPESLEDGTRPDANSSSSVDVPVDMDVVPVGPHVEDEQFALRKKRLALVIEEKQWRLEQLPVRPGTGKMRAIVEYVGAVEAYKRLCAAQTPNTVSDLLSQYVQVFQIEHGAPGYQDAYEFLCLGDDEEEEDLVLGGIPPTSNAPSAAYEASGRRGFATSSEPKGNATRLSIDVSRVDELLRALGGFADNSDDLDDEDDDDLDDASWDLLRAANKIKDGPKPLHAAQDVDGRWRWLEDDLGRALCAKPFGDFTVKLMSVETMVRNGLNVNSLHEEVDPRELVDFTGCRSWEDAIGVGREVETALALMQADGWEVDKRSWCDDVDALMVVKTLVPLRTMSFVDGKVDPRRLDGSDGKEATRIESTQKTESKNKAQKITRLRGENNAVRTPPDGKDRKTG